MDPFPVPNTTSKHRSCSNVRTWLTRQRWWVTPGLLVASLSPISQSLALSAVQEAGEQAASQSDSADATPQLKFSFHQQPWEDVLNWFARQADLSLVVDKLPPGEFTFSDTRGYTPRESIDLLNSVLMTKSFTLVRKDKMLIVLNTAEGVPYDLIPQETAEGLKERGRFELVTVTFPLEGRPVDTVQNEIKPLVGPLGRLYPMPATGNLQVTETAGKMSAIQALIESIPKPKPPKKPDPKPQPPAQVLKPYAVVDLDLEPTAELLGKAVRGINATADSKSNQIFIYATDQQHEAVAKVLETLRSNPQPDALQVQTYDYRTADPNTLSAQLRAIDPAALIQVDPTLRRLIVVAEMTKQELIQSAIEKIEGPQESSLQLRAHSVPTESQTQLTTALTEMLPGIKITPQPELEKLLIIATDSQQQQVTSILEEYREQGLMEPSGDKKLATFDLEHLDPATAIRMLGKLPGNISLEPDTEHQRLLGYLSEAQAEEIRQALSVLDVEPEKPQLQTYPLTSARYQQLQPLLPQLAPLAKVTWDSKAQQILVIANPEGQQQVSTLLQKVESLVQEDPSAVMQVYSVNPEQKTRLTAVMPTLQDQLAHVQIIPEADPRKLTVWAPQEQQETLKSLLDSLVPTPSEDAEAVMQVYSVNPEQKTRLTAVMPTLQDQLSHVQIIPEADPRKLTVWAPQEQQEALKSLLDSLVPTPSEDAEAVMRAFAVTPEQKTRFTAILPSLKDRLPDVQVLPETDPRRLTVWAPERQLAEMAQLLDTLVVEDTAATARKLSVYSLQQANPATVQQTLVKLFPSADIVLEPDAERLVIYATEDQQAEIGEAIQQLDQGEQSGSNKTSIQVYPLKNQNALTVQQAVTTLVPGLKLNIDRERNSLIAWGKDRDHRELALLLQQMEATADTGDKVMKVYDSVDQDPIELSRIVEQLAPTAVVSASRRARGIAVWATAEEHEAIGPALKQLEELDNSDQRELKTLVAVHTGAAEASRLLRGVAPEAAFFPSTDNRSLFAYADPDQQPRIQSVMEQLEERNSAQTSDELKNYNYRKAVLAAARPLITARVTKAEWVDTGAADQWLVWASSEDHQVIQQILEGMQKSLPEDSEQSLGIYVLEKVNPTDAQTTINTIVGPVTYLASPTPDQLRVWATPDQHQQIDTLIKQLQAQVSQATESRPLHIYSIDSGTDVATVYQSLGPELLAGMSVVQNPERNALIVRASEEKHAQLKTEIDSFLAALPEKVQRVPKVYPLENVTPEAARQLLVTLIPTATYAVDPTNGNLAATAQAEEHEKIAEAIRQIDVPSDQPLQTEAYRVPTGYAAAIQSSLIPIYPKARISSDATGSALVIAATEKEHVEIAKIIDDVLLGSGRGTQARVYTMKVANPFSVLNILRQVVPTSQASADFESGSVVVTATPQEHETIAQLLEDMDVAGKDRTPQVYRLRNASPQAAQQALAQAYPRAVITVDRTSNSLIATATPQDQDAIKATIQQLEANDDHDLETISYTLTGADPRSAQNALESLLPSAQFAADPRAGVLLATATKEQHERISAVVDQMENSDTNKPHARAIEVDGGNSERLYAMLSRMYRGDNDVRFTYETTSGTIMFIGPKRQEEAVMDLVDKWNAVVLKEQPRDVQVYELMEVDGDAIVDSLDELFEEQAPKPDLQVQWYTNKLIAVATPEQHEMIANTIQQIRGQQRALEVFTLVVNSPETVEDAIDQMFIDLPVGGSPSITASVKTQHIFVRATPSQLDEVRQLLIKLGEPDSVANPGSNGNSNGSSVLPSGSGRVRVLSADDADDLLQRLETVWPQVSPVPLKVMRPGSPLPTPPPASRPEQHGTQSESSSNTIRTSTARTDKPEELEAQDNDQAGSPQESQRPDQQAILVVPGTGKLTIASENEEALSLFQELFSVLKQQQSAEGKTEITGNFTVFQLENAGAREVAESVSRLYQQISSAQSRDRRGGNRSRVSIVPDERLNALIVYGPPNDRRTIEQLLKVLDTSEMPTAINRLNQARIVQVKNVEADQIMDVLQSVYRTQLRPDQPPRIQIPAGVSVEVAVALRETNAAATAPLLTLEVDQATNSIIVLASERLGTEVESLIQRLDEQNKEGNTRSIKVIALENSNTERIQQALDRMLRDNRRRGR